MSIVDPVERRLAYPFYLKMMGINALTNVDALWEDLVSAGWGATEAEVRHCWPRTTGGPLSWAPGSASSSVGIRSEKP